MSDEARFPILGEFPEDDALLPNVTVRGCQHDAHGMLVSQNADDLFEIDIQLFMSADPQGCSALMVLNAEGARETAKHLLHLAQYAEIGVEPPERER